MAFSDKKPFSVKDYSITQEQFELNHDAIYDMWNTVPKPSLENLDRYYASENYISHTDSKSTVTDKLYQWVKKWMLKYKFRIIHDFQKSGKLLDIGAGTGDFLEEAKRRHWSITGVEPSLAARNLAKAKGLNLSTNLSEISDSFHVITLWHVLEHVHDLDDYINFIKNHLAENGVALIAVPNFKSWDAKKYNAQWAAIDAPRHLYHFSQTAIQKLFETANLELVRVKPLFFDAFYVSILSEKYNNRDFPLLRGLWTGFRSNVSALRTGEYSSQIYVFQHKKPI